MNETLAKSLLLTKHLLHLLLLLYKSNAIMLINWKICLMNLIEAFRFGKLQMTKDNRLSRVHVAIFL